MLPVVTTSRGPALLILTSAFLAAVGNGISIVAFPWLVLQRSGSENGRELGRVPVPLTAHTVVTRSSGAQLGASTEDGASMGGGASRGGVPSKGAGASRTIASSAGVASSRASPGSRARER